MSIVSRALKIIWKLIKFAATALVAFVCIFLLWRIFSRGIPADMKVLSPNEKVYAAYTENSEELEYFRQGHLTLTSDGLFGAPDCIVSPEANQIQLVVRYNNSTIRALQTEYGLEKAPERSENVFDVTLLIQTDLTPEDDTDNGGNIPEAVKYTRCHGTLTLSDEKNLYNFRRMTFDLDDCGIDMKELMEDGTLLAIYADFYYVEDTDYEDTPYGTLFLYDYLAENDFEEISSKDERALKKFGKELDRG